MNQINMDYERKARCGIEEAVFCQSKSVSQINKIVGMTIEQKRNLLLTRLPESKFNALSDEVKSMLCYDPVSSVAILGDVPHVTELNQVVIVSGGSSDTAVCGEIARTLGYYGISYERYEDIGVAGLYRLTEKLEEIKKAKLVIAVAGMEAALPTVLAGLISAPIIAVPTSVGYGISEGGHLALNSCLGSCAAGLLTVNIDNGFGAACAAIKILKQFSGT